MKKTLITTLCLSALCLMAISCKDDDEPADIYDYHVHIRTPDASVKSYFDTLDIQIDFESHTGQPVHYIQVSLFDEDEFQTVWIRPANSFVNDLDGEYRFEAQIPLNINHNIDRGTWTLEASVWGAAEPDGEVTESVTFEIQ